MTEFQIVLIIIGLAIIAISYVISEKFTNETETAETLETVSQYEQRKKLTENMKEELERISEEALQSVDASLCKLSNEKIMSVNEYGDMVLDRIDKNHSEVVFLYSMLTDKEKELKELILSANSNTKEAASMEKIPEEKKQPKNKQKEPIKDNEKRQEEKLIKNSQAKELHRNKPAKEQADTTVYDERQQKILSLYKSGKSIREISQQLGIGQGEVQLVVNVSMGGK